MFSSCAESAATNITVTFPFQSGKNNVLSAIRVYYPDDYDITVETKFNQQYCAAKTWKRDQNWRQWETVRINFLTTENIFILFLLETCGCSQGQFLPPMITTVAETFTFIQATFIDAKFMVCGLGGKKKKIECIDVTIIDPSTGNCPNPDGSGDPFTPPEGYFCIQPVKEGTLSGGDYGGKIFWHGMRISKI